MLKLAIPASEQFNNVTGEFIQTKAQVLQLEHSLISLSKWESKWRKPYLSKKRKTMAESIDYIRCMTLTQNVDPNVYLALTPAMLKEVNAYIEAPMTATTFSKNVKRGANNDVITAEILYYQMIFFGIPFECQKWHLNRLLTLINVCSLKGQPPKKFSSSEILAQNRALNAARKKKWNTRG